jgi:hypothetical protein
MLQACSQGVDLKVDRHFGEGQVVRLDEDGWDAKESEVARDRQGGVVVYLHRGCL